ncbi:DUF3179 domain-containing (seleno)protein [Poriferisphaera sp. WC338]|uniref:DUF3179 domain-containing (seleno)protein n=1 Tax=Poriferisphaera sp. WC338 TaxID=3425129 RepID=UPI003D812ACA
MSISPGKQSPPYWSVSRLALAATFTLIIFSLTAWYTQPHWQQFFQPPPKRTQSTASLNLDDLEALQLTDNNNRISEHFDLSNLTIPRDQILSGGPGVDGIPSISSPQLAPISEPQPYHPDTRVITVTINRTTHIYPIHILNWHECVNDIIDATPIAVFFCPLCDSVSVVDRRFKNQTLEFGISGLLHNSNVLLYDRQTKSLYSQLKLQAISGPHAGQSLTHLSSFSITTYQQAQKQFPHAKIMTNDTGHHRNYSRNPYNDYLQSKHIMFPVSNQALDNSAQSIGIHPKTPVIALLIPDKPTTSDSRTSTTKDNSTALAISITAIQQSPNHTLTHPTPLGPITLSANPTTNTIAIINIPDGVIATHTLYFAWQAIHPNTQIILPTPSPQTQPATQPST